MRSLVIIFLLLISGCTKTINQHELKQAVLLCSEKGGIYKLIVFDDHSMRAECKNAEVISLDRSINYSN